MKAVIVDCIQKLITDKFGIDKLAEIMEKSGFPKDKKFIILQDIEDTKVIDIMKNACQVLNLSLTELFDAFADYWVMTYSQKIYGWYYRNARNAKEFLMKMDNVHSSITQNLVNAAPPRFNYTWKDEKTLIMEYNSKRGLIDLMISLAKAVGKFYNENLIVKKISETQAEIVFSKV